MNSKIDKDIFSAAYDTIDRIWGDKMGAMQIITLANQITREIEARGILAPTPVEHDEAA